MKEGQRKNSLSSLLFEPKTAWHAQRLSRLDRFLDLCPRFLLFRLLAAEQREKVSVKKGRGIDIAHGGAGKSAEAEEGGGDKEDFVVCEGKRLDEKGRDRG